MLQIGVLFIVGFLFQFLFVILGAFSGQCTFGINTRYLFAASPTLHLMRFVFFFFAVHVVLIWPITQFVSKEVEGLRSCTLRRALFAALTSIPLLSFGYYLGNFRSPLDYFELCTVVFPAVVLGIHFFEETEKSWLFSLFVSLCTYFGFFILGDLLGPFVTLFRYAPNNQGFIVWRILGPLTSVLLSTVLVRNSRRELFEETYALLGLSILTVFIKVGLSAQVILVGEKTFYWALFFPFIFGLLKWKTPTGYRYATLLVTVCAIGIVTDTLFFLSHFEALLSNVVWLILSLSSLVALFSLIFKLRTKNIQLFFVSRSINSCE